MDIIVVNMIKKAAYARKHAGVAFNIAIVYLELEGHFLAANQQNPTDTASPICFWII